MSKKVFAVKRYVQFGVEVYVYAESEKEAIHIVDSDPPDADEFLCDDYVATEVHPDDLQYISDSDIVNFNDK